MPKPDAKNKLLSLQKRWRAESFAYCLLLSLSVSLPLTTLLHVGWQLPLWIGAVILAACIPAALWMFPSWRVDLTDVARYLNKQLPELEESCGLFLRPAGDLGPLEKWQIARTETKLAPLRSPRPLYRKLLVAAWMLLAAVILSAGIAMDGSAYGRRSAAPAANGIGTVAEKPAPGIQSIAIRIIPPAYTGRAVRRQEKDLNLRVEDGGLLNWEVQTTGFVRSLQFIFNDSVRLALRAADPKHTLWRASRSAAHSGFYQLDLDGRLSALYTIEVVKDEPPHITIETPKPYTVLDIGESMTIPLVVKLRDDYGIADAAVVATIASGNGEAVKFKEQTIRFGRIFPGDQPYYDLRQVMDLSALGLRPGDELYFYCRAKDNRGQESRSDMYIISLPDTAQLMSLQGLTAGVDIKPEYFRSERQIIIETEQLLKEKDSVPMQQFNNRSNGLGIDQKLLRLRYGKFLGEEAEEGERGGDGEEDPRKPGTGGKKESSGDAGGGAQPDGFGDAKKILDAYTDKHDNAEDASYFEPAVKEQLKATLTEMWGAELRLRTFKPREALPYAYKALRLLKDLQQKSRAYVAKTGLRVTPLDPAKRLAGKLDDISPPVERQTPGQGSSPAPEQVLRIALGLVEQADGMAARGGGMGKGSVEILRGASRRLGSEAARRPVEYLAGYQAMRRILDEGGGAGAAATPGAARVPRGPVAADALLVGQAIRKLLPDAEPSPSAGRAPADEGLSQLYFSHINGPSGKP
jgi:Domain of unknown function (DUF4175)